MPSKKERMKEARNLAVEFQLIFISVLFGFLLSIFWDSLIELVHPNQFIVFLASIAALLIILPIFSLAIKSLIKASKDGALSLNLSRLGLRGSFSIILGIILFILAIILTVYPI